MAWSTVRTWVVLGRWASHCTKEVNLSRSMELLEHPEQMWWNTSGTQPPRSFSAWVTYCFSMSTVVSDCTEVLVLICHRSAGGSVSAVAHSVHP